MPNNYTRFFVVGKGDPPRSDRCKTSLVFAVPNTPGSLYHALGEFATRQVNLTKLESRPRRNRPWQYVFYSISTATGKTPTSARLWSGC
jgi:prephenate dehydratase